VFAANPLPETWKESAEVTTLGVTETLGDADTYLTLAKTNRIAKSNGTVTTVLVIRPVDQTLKLEEVREWTIRLV
jgi:hypothetical protein